MHEECLICGAPLVYLTQDEEMECALCHRRERSKTRCQKGHYVCNTCHTRGLDQLVALCRREESRNPWTILEHLMAQPFCHMHGPEHHTMVGAALLTAYRNAGGALDLEQALPEMLRRGSQVPGGACGFWGACGAGISAGMYVSIATGATPLAGEPWGLANGMTSQALARIGAVGGPRCCKRNAHLAIQAAVDFTRANLGVDLEGDAAPCTHFPENNQCLRDRCPFYPREGRRPKVAFLCVHNACRSQMAEALGNLLHASTFAWSPESKIAGTFFPIQSSGLLYCGYSNKFPSKDSVVPDSSFASTPGTIRDIASTMTIAGSSPPVST